MSRRSSSRPATMRDLDRLALELPETTCSLTAGRPAYAVRGKTFCWHREPRKDAIDAETGERLTDVLVFHVDGPDEKELVLAAGRGLFFTTPHFRDYPAVLLRIPSLAALTVGELREVVVGSWLARAPKRTAEEWLAAQTT